MSAGGAPPLDAAIGLRRGLGVSSSGGAAAGVGASASACTSAALVLAKSHFCVTYTNASNKQSPKQTLLWVGLRVIPLVSFARTSAARPLRCREVSLLLALTLSC